MLIRYGLGTILAASALAQAPVMPELPNGPAKPGFDISRFARTAVGTFETFYVKETYPLKVILDEGKVAPDTRLLVIEPQQTFTRWYGFSLTFPGSEVFGQ